MCSIVGVVRLAGDLKPDKLKRWENDRCGGRPLDVSALRTIILGEDRTLANVYVAVNSGLGDRKYATPKSTLLLDQIECVYKPRVLGLMTNQTLILRNSDDTIHNFHIDLGYGAEFDRGHYRGGEEKALRFPRPEVGKIVKCDVHPWMIGWIHISDHPFFAVTGIDGQYLLKDLPPGEYEILAWHERFKEKPLIAKVRVEAGKAATLDFTFEAPVAPDSKR